MSSQDHPSTDEATIAAQKLVVLGADDALEAVVRNAEHSTTSYSIAALRLEAEDGFNFVLPVLTAFPREEWQAFVAVDERALNLPRLRMVSQLKAAGYRLAKIISKGAVLAKTAAVGENTVIYGSSIVGERCALGLNVIVGHGAVIRDDVKIGSSTFIGQRAMIGQGATVGDCVTLGADVVLADGTAIGKYCELAHKRTYCGTIPASTFYVAGFENPIKIVSPY